MTKLRGHNYSYVRFSVGGRYRMERRLEDRRLQVRLELCGDLHCLFFILFFITF